MAVLNETLTAFKQGDYIWLALYLLVVLAILALAIFGLKSAYRAAFPKPPAPKLAIDIDSVIQSNISDPTLPKHVIVLYASISNTGAPSVVEGFSLKLKRGTFSKAKLLTPTIFTTQQTINANEKKITLLHSDLLINKAMPTPVQNGGKVRGHIEFLHNMPREELENIAITLLAKDVNGKTIKGKKLLLSKGNSGSVLYYPGMKLPQ